MADKIYNHKIAARIRASEGLLKVSSNLEDWHRRQIQESIDRDVKTLAQHGYDRDGYKRKEF